MQFFSHLPHRIFLIFCISLEGDIRHSLAETACRNDFSFSIYWGKRGKIGVRIWARAPHLITKTTHFTRLFPSYRRLCIKSYIYTLFIKKLFRSYCIVLKNRGYKTMFLNVICLVQNLAFIKWILQRYLFISLRKSSSSCNTTAMP